MLAFTLKRLGSGLVLLVVLTIGTFFLAHLAFSDPASAVLGGSATPDQKAALVARLGLDRPLLAQFGDWARHAVTGDLGTSWTSGQPVTTELALKLPVTLSVVGAATLLAAVLGVGLGFWAGSRPGSVLDGVLTWFGVVLFALPGFWVSVVLVVWFAVRLAWFPAVGYVEPSQSVGRWLASITLPAVSLAVGAVVAIAQQLRNAVVRIDGLDYVRTLRARGLSTVRVRLHVLRNAAPTALTVLALQFVALIGGAIVVEQVFALPGIGAVTSSASSRADIPVLVGLTVVSVVFVVLVNLLMEIALGLVNPRVRTR